MLPRRLSQPELGDSVRCISCNSAREYKSLFAKMRINDLVVNKSVGFDCLEHRRYLAFCLRTKLKSTRARCLKTWVQRRLETCTYHGSHSILCPERLMKWKRG